MHDNNTLQKTENIPDVQSLSARSANRKVRKFAALHAALSHVLAKSSGTSKPCTGAGAAFQPMSQ